MIQCYTGEGKGKTTSALGAGLRAHGHGLTVKMVQFLKAQDSGELKSAPFKIHRVCTLDKFYPFMSDEEKDFTKSEVLKGLKLCELLKVQSDVLILDEILCCVEESIIDEDVLCDFIEKFPKEKELVLTGRGATGKIIELCDYVSEIKMIKHPCEKGIDARKGIEF